MTKRELKWTCFKLRWKLRFWMLKYVPDAIWDKGRIVAYRKTPFKRFYPFGVSLKSFMQESRGEVRS